MRLVRRHLRFLLCLPPPLPLPIPCLLLTVHPLTGNLLLIFFSFRVFIWIELINILIKRRTRRRRCSTLLNFCLHSLFLFFFFTEIFFESLYHFSYYYNVLLFNPFMNNIFIYRLHPMMKLPNSRHHFFSSYWLQMLPLLPLKRY